MDKILASYLAECYQTLNKHCYHNDGSPVFNQEKIDKATLACQFDLLVLIKNNFSSLEKIALLSAKEYWLYEALELTPVIQLLAQKLSDGIIYKTPKIRAKRHCLLSLLQIDNDNLFEGLESFFDQFSLLDIAPNFVKPVLDNQFDGALRRINYKIPEPISSTSFSFKTLG